MSKGWHFKLKYYLAVKLFIQKCTENKVYSGFCDYLWRILETLVIKGMLLRQRKLILCMVLSSDAHLSLRGGI